MKRLMTIAAVLAIGILVTTVAGIAMAESKKGPVGKVVNATVDTTKKVGEVAGDTVGTVSDTAATATKGMTGATGDMIQTVSGTAITTTEGAAGATGDTVKAVSDTTEKVAADITK